MNFTIPLFLCGLAWVLTIVRFKGIHWRNIGVDNRIALNVWLMMLFFSITLTLLVDKSGDFLDAHTFNNLDRLVTYCSILTGISFGVVASIEAVGKPSDRGLIPWFRWGLIFTTITLVTIYVLFISKIPNINYYIPHSLPESLFMLIAYCYGAFLCLSVDRVYISYLPSEKSAVMRTRAILIIISTFFALTYFVVKIITVGGYFLPILGSPALTDLASGLLILSALLHLSALLSNRIYVRIVVLTRNVQSWSSYQDLKYLVRLLRQYCPEIALPTADPSIWRFLLNPEYFLYRSVVSILDGQTMLGDFLSENGRSDSFTHWDEGTRQKALQIKQVLAQANPTGDFRKIVDEYSRVSRHLLPSQNAIIFQEEYRNDAS